MLWRVAVLAVGVAAVLAPVASACIESAATPTAGTAVANPSGRRLTVPYNSWITAAKVPTPDDTVVVNPDVAAICGIGLLTACSVPEYGDHPPTMGYDRRGIARKERRYVFFHELGHIFDSTAMTSGARARFTRLAGYPKHFGWWDERGDYDQPLEEFADAYALCAMYGARPPYSFWGATGYWPVPRKTHGKICALVRAIGHVA